MLGFEYTFKITVADFTWMKSLVDLSKHVLQVYLVQNFKLTTFLISPPFQLPYHKT